MESISNVAKRKKRKTRKCLDEIRKRSRRSSHILFEKDDTKVGEIHSKNLQQRMITNDRLTLRFFPKAVQSKTITRPSLLDLQHKPSLNLEELVKGTKVVSAQNATVVRIPLNDFGNRTEIFNNAKRLLENCNHKIPIVRNSEENEENFELFSSMDELTNKSSNSIGTPSGSNITSTSSQSLHEDNGYSLYEEFMSQIPACLQETSKLIQEDVMKKTKMQLHNLFIESCYQECENKIINRVKKDAPKNMYLTSEEVVHDPMYYIRLGHLQQQSQFKKFRGSISESGSSSHSPLRAPPSCPTSPSDTPISVVIHDTPDYTYYPHRMN